MEVVRTVHTQALLLSFYRTMKFREWGLRLGGDSLPAGGQAQVKQAFDDER